MDLKRRIHELVMVSYYLHLFVVRLPYISTHVTGYMAKITPVCFWWGTVSLAATLLYLVMYGRLLAEIEVLASGYDYWMNKSLEQEQALEAVDILEVPK